MLRTPNLVGRVLSVDKTSYHYFRSVMVLENAKQINPNQDLNGLQKVYFIATIEELGVVQGNEVNCSATLDPSDGTWVGEGLPSKVFRD